MEKLTPMMEQYLRVKKENKEAVLLFHLGDFYEMFFEDARTAAKVLHIALTSRKSGGKKIPMAGIPCHAAQNYIARLVSAGYKVAICEQVEDAKLAKGLVKRETTRIITPGTILDSSLLEEKTNNYIVALNRDGEQRFGIAISDISTGEFKVTELARESAVISELTRLGPRECLLPGELAGDKHFRELMEQLGIVVTVVEDWQFFHDSAHGVLTSHFRTQSLEGFGVEKMILAVGCAGAMISYLEETQKTVLSHINRLVSYSTSEFMVIDRTTQRNLELVSNFTGGKEGTLLRVLDKTVTAMGGRTLRRWFLQPLLSVDKIKERQRAVTELVEDVSRRKSLEEKLSGISDIERLISRIACKTANARDLVALKDSLKSITPIREELKAFRSKLLAGLELPDLSEITDLLEKAIVDEPPLSLREGNLIKDGFNQELDELRSISKDGKNWIAGLEAREIKRTGINSLKVRYNRVFGYYIEVTKTNLRSVPSDYIRKQTLVNSERFLTPELKEYESRVLNARERIEELEYRIFTEVREKTSEKVEEIQKIAQSLGILDVLISLAEAAVSNSYKCPVVDESDEITITEGRHPVLQQVLGINNFIPNDTKLDCNGDRILIITGPNMAGKSTYIRQVALLTLMAQIGSFIPVRQAKIGIVDRIFTRVGASDELMRGRSTFMVEMNETANILNNATSRSLIILDEIGRGTSTFDGVSIAWAVAEYLHNHAEVSAKTLFATHFHELTALAVALSGVKNYNVAVREWNDEVIFLRKVVPGATDRSYGIHVAQLAGLPGEVIERAREILAELEEEHYDSDGKPRIARMDGMPEKQLSLFSRGAKPVKNGGSPDGVNGLSERKHPVVEELKKLEVDKLTPIQALNKIHELKKKLEEKSGKQNKNSS